MTSFPLLEPFHVRVVHGDSAANPIPKTDWPPPIHVNRDSEQHNDRDFCEMLRKLSRA